MAEITREQVLMSLISGRGPAFLRGVNLSSLDLSGAGWLEEADLRGADLSNANLRRALLKGANLERANLHSAILMGTNLEGANLFRVKANVANMSLANLRSANLRETALVGTNLARADLEEADLDGADLEGANLQGCNLRRARLTNVNLKLASFDGADLTDAIFQPAGSPGVPGGGAQKDFHGTITSVKLTDLIQIGCLSRSELNIEVYSDAGKGNIYIGSGRVLHAETGSLKGEEAFSHILAWDSGRFITVPSLPNATTTIDKPVMHLIMQALRLRDEHQHSGKHTGLIHKMKELIPIEAVPTTDLVSLFRKEGKDLSHAKLEITDIFDSNENEEILCSISAQGEMLIAPLKLVELDRKHPLYPEFSAIK
ncbi:MAG: pentapeptide repeat-containing protein [Desulfobacteraceae bacterium]|nr:pentapeptide repeat-containing protein [Desulfobacteraceae bacterium]